jgi:hypothetical protein
MIPGLAVIGLVCMAIGGTFLEKWQKPRNQTRMRPSTARNWGFGLILGGAGLVLWATHLLELSFV